VLPVTAATPGARLPTTEVVAPKGLWRFVFTRLLAVAAIALVMVWAISNTPKGMIEAIVFLAVVVVIAAIQVPFLQRRWQRLEERRLESLPADTIYAGPARVETPASAGGGRPVAGEIVLDGLGLSFTPKHTGQAPPLRFSWAEMSHLALHPISMAPLAGSLELTLAKGTTHRFLVQRCASLADELRHLPDRI
jgi:hypothetical protein